MKAKMATAAQPNEVGTSGAKDNGFQLPKRKKRNPKQVQATKGIVIGQLKPKFQYVPKKKVTFATGKGKEVVVDTGTTQDTADTTDSSTTPVIIQSTGTPVPETSPGTPDPLPTPGNQAFPSHTNVPVSAPNIETRNQFEGLSGANTDDISIPIAATIERKALDTVDDDTIPTVNPTPTGTDAKATGKNHGKKKRNLILGIRPSCINDGKQFTGPLYRTHMLSGPRMMMMRMMFLI